MILSFFDGLLPAMEATPLSKVDSNTTLYHPNSAWEKGGYLYVLEGAARNMSDWRQFCCDGSANFSVGVRQSCPNGHG